MSNRARNPLSRKLMFAAAFVMVSAIATLAAFGPQALSLQKLLTPFVGASVAPQQSFKEVESQLHAEPPAPLALPGGTLATPRSGHTATLLADGKVLIVGGSGDTSAEVFDPADGTAVATGNTNYARTGHTATRLADGRVLIAGGGSASTELYDPATGTFSNGPEMTAARSGHTATAVGGSVVITGGGSDSVEVFNGTSFTAAGTLTTARTNHSAAAMNDGRVFIAGGTGSDTAEIYNPADGTSVATGNSLAHQRAKAHLRVLPDGKVQIIGGNNDVSMEVYDPAIDTIGAHVHLLPDTDTCTGLRTGVRDSQTRAALFYAGNADAAYDRTGHTITEVAGNQALVIGGTTGGSATGAVTEFASSPATITTDKLDYAPGETVTFTGTNFAPGETVRVVIHEDPHTHLERNFEATADGSGNISGSYLVEEHDLDVKFVVNARGLTSNLTAQTAFTDGQVRVKAVGTGVTPANIDWAKFPNATCTGSPTSSGTISAITSGSGTGIPGDTPDSGGALRLTAQNPSGFTFSNWSGGVGSPNPNSANPICLVYQNGTRNIDANFVSASGTTIAVAAATGTYGGNVNLSATLSQTSPSTPLSGQLVTFSLNGGVTTTTATTDVNGVATASVSLAGINAGTYPTGVSASFAGGSGFAASSGTASLTVNKATPTATLAVNNSPQTYSGSPQSATVGITASSVPGAVANVTNGTHTDAGTYPVTADFVPTDSANYNTLTGLSAGDFVISKAGSTTTITCLANVTYTGSALTPCTVSVTGAGGLSLTPTATYTDNTNAGTATASYTFAGDANHDGSSDSKTFTIDKASSTTTVTCPAGPYTYSGSAIEPCSVSVTGAGGLNLTPTPTYSNNVNAGTASASYTFTGDSNHNGSSDSETFTIDQASSLTVVTCPVSVQYTSLEQEPCTVSVTGANLNLAPNASYLNNENVGTATASYTYGGDLNHTGSSDSKTFQITAIALTINGAVANDKVYDGDNTATVNFVGATLATPIAGDAVSINSSGYSATFDDENVDQDKPVTVTGVTLSGVDAENYTVSQPTGLTADITAKQITLVDAVANGKVYDGTTDATVDFTNADLDGVESGDVVSFDASLYDAEFADKDVNVTITVTVTGVTLTGAQAGNYELVDPTLLFADITPRLVTVSINPQTKVFDGNTSATLVAADFVVTTGVTGESFTVNQTVGAYNDANVANATTVTASLLEANFVPDNGATLLSNYDFPASASGPGSITKAPTTTTVTFEAGPYVYRGSAFTATASVTGAGGLNQPVTPVNVSGDCVNVTVANGCTATATYAESANHFSSNDSGSITILKANATVIVNAYDVVYDGLSHTSTYSITGVNGESGATVGTIDVSGTTHTDAGTYNNDPWTFTGTGNYNDTSGTVNNQIDKANATCNISGYGPLPYDGASHGASGSCTGVGGSADVLTGLSLGASFTNAPGGTANWAFTDVTGNYNNDSGSVQIDITKANAVVVVTPYDVTYDGNAHAAAVTSITGVNGETGATVGTVDVSGTTHTNAGTYNDTWSFTGTTNYNDQLNVPITNQIDQASVTATAGSGSNVYDGATHAPSACVVSGAFTGTLSCANDPSVVGPNAGTTVIEPVTTGPDLANFIVTEVNGSYEISKANAAIVVTPYDVVYDGNSHTATGTATGAGGENLNALLDLSGTAHTNAAAYPGDPWSFAGDANHNPDSGTVDDNISKASVTATAGGGSATYDGNTKTPAACVVSGAYIGSLSCVNVPTAIGPGAGTYTVEPSTSGPDLANFIVTPANGTFTISKATTSTVVTCGAGPFVYSGLAQEPCTAQVTGAGGLSQSLTVTYSNNVNAGLATASASYAESANYFGSNDSKNFTIGKKQVSVTASSPTLPYNSAVPTITPIYGGLVNSETGAVIDVPPTCSVAGYSVGSPVGSYTTSCTGGSDNNYSFGPYVNGTFTVTTIYCFNGFFSPVGGSVESGNGGSSLDPVRTFKLNSTIPFKFALYNLGNCSGTPVTTGIHTIQLQKINSNNELDTAIDATPTDAATTGNQFRLTGTEWHFNLDTKKAVPNVSAGTWLVTATLQDGSKKTVWISIKK